LISLATKREAQENLLPIIQELLRMSPQ